MLGHLEGFSHKDSQPWELNTPSKEVFGKSNKTTWHSKWITLSQKFSSKSLWDSKSRNLSIEEREEEEEEPRWNIKFFEGIDFLGAIAGN